MVRKRVQIGRGNFNGDSRIPSDDAHDDNSSHDDRTNEQPETPRRDPSFESRFVIYLERYIKTYAPMPRRQALIMMKCETQDNDIEIR